MPGDRFLELASAEDRRVLDALFRDAREGVTIQGRDGLVYANRKAARLMGFSSGPAMMGADLSAVMGQMEMINEHGEPFPLDLLPGRRVLAGEETSEVTIGYRLPGSREVRWSRVGASPIKNDAGEVVWALNFFLDITTEMRLQAMERIMSQVSETLSSSLRTEANLKALAEVVVPSVASWCGFRLLDEFGRPSSEVIAYPGSPEAEDLFQLTDLVAKTAVDGVMVPAVDDTAEHFGEVDEEVLRRVEDERGAEAAKLLEDLDVGSVVCLPLVAGGVPLGQLTLARTRAEGTFDSLDLAFIRELASRAAVALGNSQVFEHEHETAEALRIGLTPWHIPNIANLEIATRYHPLARTGHVGGDFFDVIDLGEDLAVLVIGDVEGKGVGAAATVGMVRHTLRATVGLERDPQVVFQQLNRALGESPMARMCTLAYVVLERAGAGFAGSVSLAGHPPPLILRADGSREPVGRACPPAGLIPEIEPTPKSFELASGDVLIAYTDGIATPEEPSPDTVERLLGSPGEQPEDLLDDMLARFYDEVPEPRDDIALLAVKVVAEDEQSAT